jgi:hypothetical protein
MIIWRVCLQLFVCGRAVAGTGSSGRLLRRLRIFELLHQAQGIPIPPGFYDLLPIEAVDGDASKGEIVPAANGPAHYHAVAFCDEVLNGEVGIESADIQFHPVHVSLTTGTKLRSGRIMEHVVRPHDLFDDGEVALIPTFVHKPLRNKLVFRRRQSSSYGLRGLIVPLLKAGNKRCYREAIAPRKRAAVAPVSRSAANRGLRGSHNIVVSP